MKGIHNCKLCSIVAQGGLEPTKFCNQLHIWPHIGAKKDKVTFYMVETRHRGELDQIL